VACYNHLQNTCFEFEGFLLVHNGLRSRFTKISFGHAYEPMVPISSEILELSIAYESRTIGS
jgi:hypothetical protein